MYIIYTSRTALWLYIIILYDARAGEEGTVRFMDIIIIILYYIILNVILCPYTTNNVAIYTEWNEFLKSKKYFATPIGTLKYIMRYKPVREYRFYWNSRGGWIYKSFFSIRPSSRMQVGAIRDIDNGGRSFWKKKTRPKSYEFKIL